LENYLNLVELSFPGGDQMAKPKWVDYKALKAKLDDVKDRISELEENFEEKIEEHPIKSVAIAFGAGVLAGALTYFFAKRK